MMNLFRLLFAISFLCNASSVDNHLLFSSGDVDGSYFQIAGALVRELNNTGENRAVVIPSEGSQANLEYVNRGEADFALVQSDIFGEQLSTQAGAVVVVGQETVNLLASDSSGVISISGLRGKHVNLGPEGSGHRQNAIAILDVLLPKWRKQVRHYSLPIPEAVEKIHQFKLDATFMTTSHPGKSITNASIGKRKMHLVPIQPADQLIANVPAFQRALIERKFYPELSNWRDIPTVGVSTILVAGHHVSNEQVAKVCDIILSHREKLAVRIPFFKSSDLTNLKPERLPMHTGSKTCFKAH